MILKIPKDQFDNPTIPRIFLCNTSKTRLTELQPYDVTLDAKWMSYDTLNLSVDATYVDMIDGETKRTPYFNKLEGLRNIEVEGGYGYFTIQDPDDSYGDKNSKTLSCFSAEYSTFGSKYLESFKINTGDVDSVEVMYNSEKFGDNYTVDNLYTLALKDNYDAFEDYYAKEYTDTDDYTWERVEISEEGNKNSGYLSHFEGGVNEHEPLYIKKYPNVRFYWKTNPRLSLLDLILEKTPGWTIGHVDANLQKRERKFDIDRESVYNFLINDVTEKMGCIVEFDNIKNQINVYEATEDGLTEDETIADDWASDVYISKENLASQINIKYSTDDIVTRLKVSGADDISVREVNLGQNYIMNLDYYHNLDWMEQDLYEGYQDYLDAVAIYQPKHKEAMKNWVSAYNAWDTLMNTVPIEGNVLLVGDEFKKLYCTYTPQDNAYIPNVELSDQNINQYRTITDLYSTKKDLYVDSDKINKAELSNGAIFCVQGYKYVYNQTNNNFEYQGNFYDINTKALINKLDLYLVNEDLDGTKTDNILLRLKDDNDNTAVIRIYDPHIQVTKWSDELSGRVIYSRHLELNKITYEAVGGGRDINEITFNELKTKYTNLYISDYQISYQIYYAYEGTSKVMNYSEIDGQRHPFNLDAWIRGKLITDSSGHPNFNELKGYKITYIGTMGAYLCLAKQEVQDAGGEVYEPTEYLRSFGINLLREKKKLYTTIFQTQTEALFSKEKYQCIAINNEPVGTFPNGTRWLDTNSYPAQLYVYNETKNKWEPVDGTIPESERGEYANYQRYIDNFNKLMAVQNVLIEKEREATYYLNGHEVPNLRIDTERPKLTAGGEISEEPFVRAANNHFPPPYLNTRMGFDEETLVYTFTTTADKGKHTYAVYVNDKVPYVAYANSRVIYQNQMNRFAEKSQINNFFTKDQLERLMPFIREGEYSNENILVTTYDSEEERVSVYEELIEDAGKELKKISQPNLEFSMTMANILALPEFEPLIKKDQFQLGKFIRIDLDNNLIKRARLLEAHLNFSDLSDFNVNFGNLVKHKDEVDRTADLLKQAISAGKQVSVSASAWNKAAEKSTKLETEIENGLQASAIKVGSASGQAISWDQTGFHARKYMSGSTTEYAPEEIAILNNALVATNDSWKTSKGVFGSFTVDNKEHWGVLADAVVAGYIESPTIVGGTIAIGDPNGTQFIVDEQGQMSMKYNGVEVANSSTIADLSNGGFYVDIVYTTSTVFTTSNSSCELTAKVYSGDKEITSEIMANGAKFSWIRVSNVDDTSWNTAHENQTSNKLVIKNQDLEGNATFTCDVNFDYQ